MRTMGSNRSNEQLMGRDRRGSLGMDSSDYNSSSSGYFDEHADYETQQQAVYEFQHSTTHHHKSQWLPRSRGGPGAQPGNSRPSMQHSGGGRTYAREVAEPSADVGSREQFSNEKGHPSRGQASCGGHHPQRQRNVQKSYHPALCEDGEWKKSSKYSQGHGYNQGPMQNPHSNRKVQNSQM